MNFNEIDRRDRIMVALDCSAEEALALGRQLQGHAKWVKVGMTLYYAQGPAIVDAFHEMGFKVFVDLKLHDIPHQVQGAAAAIAATGADLMTIHATGAAPMMQAAMEGAKQAGEGRPIVCAVTVLTSMNAENLASIGVDSEPAQQVERLARLVKEAGVDGVVCSPQEAANLRAILGPEAAIVTPGVRPAGAALGDQQRVATPRAAFEAGASHLVIGRPITAAPDPVQAFESICSEL